MSVALKEIAKRKRDFMIYQEYIYDYDELGITTTEYRTVLEDPHVYAGVQQRKGQIQQMGWELQVPENYAHKKEILLFLNELSFEEVISEILNCVLFGYSVLEITWKKEGSRYVPAAITEKPSDWFRFDEKRELVYLEDFNNVKQLPDFKFLVAKHKGTYEFPYGEKIVKKIYKYVKQKEIGVEMWQKLVERYGMPSLVGRYAVGATEDEKSEFLESLQTMVEDNITVMSADETFEFPESAKYNVGEVFEKMLHFYNLEISKAILTVTLTTEITQVGSYKTAQIHKEMLEYLGLADKKIVETVIDQLIEWYVLLNYGKEDITPKLNFVVKEKIIESTIERDKILKEIGVKFTAEYFKKRYNLTEEDFVLSEKSKVRSEKQKDRSQITEVRRQT